MNLQELKKEESRLKRELDANQMEQRRINEEAFLKKYDLKIGDKVSFVDSGKEKLGVVKRFDYVGNEVSWMFVSLLNSNSTVGKRESRMWSKCLETIKKV